MKTILRFVTHRTIKYVFNHENGKSKRLDVQWDKVDLLADACILERT